MTPEQAVAVLRKAAGRPYNRTHFECARATAVADGHDPSTMAPRDFALTYLVPLGIVEGEKTWSMPECIKFLERRYNV